jgi:cytochrome c5
MICYILSAMKRVLFGLMGVMLAGCALQQELPPAPDEAMVKSSGSSAVTLQRGRAAYVSECARCHEAKMPDAITDEDWHVILPGMAWNAGMSEGDEDAVEAYIKAVKGM